jgi:crossover junction endodeoxyribonuclease RuvC
MRILGIDPGSRKTGWALIEVEGRKIRYLTSGVLRFDKVDNFLDRIILIFNSCQKLKNEFNPDEISIESLIYVKSVDALSKLAQARGAMIAAFSNEHAKNIFEYSPNLIKVAVTGHGHASKEAVDKTLSMMFGKIDFNTSDESDALAISVCHALNRGVNLKKELMI